MLLCGHHPPVCSMHCSGVGTGSRKSDVAVALTSSQSIVVAMVFKHLPMVPLPLFARGIGYHIGNGFLSTVHRFTNILRRQIAGPRLSSESPPLTPIVYSLHCLHVHEIFKL